MSSSSELDEINSNERVQLGVAIPLLVKARWNATVKKNQRSATLTALMKQYLRMELSDREKELINSK